MSELIRVEGVCKRYNRKDILKNVNLNIEAGKGICLVGHNGTGKSTLLKMIAGFVQTDGGNIVKKKGIKLSYVPEQFPAIDFTVAKYLQQVANVLNMSADEYKQRRDYYLENFRMTEMIDTKLKHLSKGSLQKVVVIQAFLQRPDVLLLDEPLSGQDADSQKFFIEEVLKMKSEGMAFVMSCHEKFLIRRISDKVYRIHKMELKEELLNKYINRERVVMTFANRSEELPVHLQELGKVRWHNKTFEVITRRHKSNEILIQFLNEGYELLRMEEIEV